MGHPFTTRGGLVTDNSNEEVPDGQVRYYLSSCTVHIDCYNIVSLSIDFIKFLNQNLLQYILSLSLSLSSPLPLPLGSSICIIL